MRRFPALAALFLATVFAAAQEATPTVTDKDVLTLSPAQIEVLQAYQAFAPIRDKAYAEVDRQLQTTKEYKRLDAANAALTLAVNEVYSAHKLAPTEQQICFGPTAEGPCKGAPEKKYVFRAVPRPKAEVARKEAPKAEGGAK